MIIEGKDTLVTLSPDFLTFLHDDFIMYRNDKIHCFRTYRNKVATSEYIPWPIEIRFCEPKIATNQTKSPPRLA